MAERGFSPASWAGPATGQRDETNDSLAVPVVGFQPQNPFQNRGYSTSSSEQNIHTLRRRSSIAGRFTSLGDAGGVNSFNNFARSWQRAAVFPEFAGGRQSFVTSQEDGDSTQDIEHATHDRPPPTRQSLLRAALEHERQNAAETPVVDDADSHEDVVFPPLSAVERRLSERRSSPRQNSILQLDPGFASPFVGSYGSITSRIDEAAVVSRRVPEIVRPGPAPSSSDEDEPLLIKQTEAEEQAKVSFVIGQSTIPQTIFNSVNTLIGVGMLSLPLAIRYSGWVFGLGFFAFASVATSYTAKILAKCLDVDASLITFADLAYISFGTHARVAVSILFCLELVASCVALVVLFADSMNALIESFGILEYKILCGIIIVPLAFVPLRFLSFSSVLGIICCITIVTGVLIDGIIKSQSPGSLRDPATTYPTPKNWLTLPLAFGLLMAPWGGHSVFPNIYRDMRHPMKYNKAVNYTYAFTLSLEVVIAIIGYLMFGEHVHDEVTSNIFMTPGYPRWVSYVIAIAVCIIPLTKIPLNARPIYSTCEFFLGLTKQPQSIALGQRRSAVTQNILRIAIRLIIMFLFVVLAILVPSFDTVMALLGSLACSLVCVVLPCSFHLKIFGKQLSFREKILDSALIAVFITGGVIGTVCACLPKRWLGAEK